MHSHNQSSATHPPLGVNATPQEESIYVDLGPNMFRWAPTLGGECYGTLMTIKELAHRLFQWAPTLGGECYEWIRATAEEHFHEFQWAPTLGGECYCALNNS